MRLHGLARRKVGLVTSAVAPPGAAPDRTTAFLCGPEPMLRFGAEALVAKGHVAAQDIRVSLERNMQCGIGWCGHCQLGPLLLCRDGPVVGYDVAGPAAARQGAVDEPPTLAVWKFASCDGCQLTLLDCEDELLTLAEQVQIATSPKPPARSVAGPYDVSLVEGSITTAATNGASARSGSSPRCWSPSARARRLGDAGLAQLRRRHRVRLRRLRPTRVHRHAGDLDAGVGARQGRLPATGLPYRPRVSCSTLWRRC